MKHSVHFNNRDNTWDNALPMGNGCFGGMIYHEDNVLHMVMNHYEVYHFVRKNVLPDDIRKGYKPPKEKGLAYKRYCDWADRNQPKDGEPFCYYREEATEAFDPEPYAEASFSSSNPSSGELQFFFDDCLYDAQEALTLFVEDAKIDFSLQSSGSDISISTITTRRDCIINNVQQTRPGLLKRIGINMASYRGQDPIDITYQQIDPSTFAYTVSRIPDKAEVPFIFSGIVKLVGTTGKLIPDGQNADILLDSASCNFHVLSGVFTQWRYQDPLCVGLEYMRDCADSLDTLYQDHQAYWKQFFEQSSIDLPDKFLEHVYYVNQYALDCCSGKDGIMKHHACGLNGLWDIRRPCLWRSVWYWDINIQASFAGVFSSNRLDLAKVFSDGLLSYQKLAEDFARDAYNMPGVAIDYPYQSYFCIWPWCAQYLWFLYEYSLDKEYLRNDAYPLFLKLCQFCLALFRYDETTDTYYVYPDISPEQGPLAHNTTITIACVKYLLRFTLEAAKILEDNDPLLPQIQNLLNKMPPYAMSKEKGNSVHLKDSPDAPDNLWIRHPGMLMPLFPIAEYDAATTDSEMLQILSNTVDYLEDRCEIGVFGGSWLSAAAARLGRGQTSLRMLYERGIDHMLRSNGLTAEETERFMNFCLINRQPLFYPCMMEYTGEMLAAVNEMLLQSYNGLIRVFPAIPDGNREWERFHRNGYSYSEYIDRCVDYDAWKNVRFDKFLAKGAFEISASMTGKKLDWIKVHSKKGGTVCLTSPFLTEDFIVFCDDEQAAFVIQNGIMRFDTEEGKRYLIAHHADVDTSTAKSEYIPQVLSRETYTKRKVFIGENEQVTYYKAVDGFLRDWYLGNHRMANHTLYKFDFGVVENKVYTKDWARQAYVSYDMVLTQTPIIFLAQESAQYTIKQGFGFLDASRITAFDRGSPDSFRRDFVQGTDPVEFVIDVPRGQYEVLVISGDEVEDNVTIIETENGAKYGGERVKQGIYQCELIPIVQKKDRPIRLKISTKSGYSWKINCLFLNTIKGY